LECALFLAEMGMETVTPEMETEHPEMETEIRGVGRA
jgi:hypothetical protein